MKYQIHTTPWPVGDRLIPVGSVIDDVSPENDFSHLVRARRAPPPINSTALNQTTMNALKKMYPDFVHQLRAGPGVHR